MKIKLPIAYSGVRPGEEPDVIRLIADCQLTTEDLSAKMLKDFIVGRRGNRIVGVVGLEITKHGALLRSLAVAESDRNRGVGDGLVRSAERYARSRGVQTIFLLTMTAEAFFVRLDYRAFERSAAPEEIQATNEFKTLCPYSAVCLRKDL